MSPRRAFVWLVVLTVALTALTLVIHYAPITLPAPATPAPANGIVVPSSDTPTLTASVRLPSTSGRPST